MPREVARHIAVCSVHACKFNDRSDPTLHPNEEKATREALSHALAQHVGTKHVTVRRTYTLASEEIVG